MFYNTKFHFKLRDVEKKKKKSLVFGLNHETPCIAIYFYIVGYLLNIVYVAKDVSKSVLVMIFFLFCY